LKDDKVIGIIWSSIVKDVSYGLLGAAKEGFNEAIQPHAELTHKGLNEY